MKLVPLLNEHDMELIVLYSHMDKKLQQSQDNQEMNHMIDQNDTFVCKNDHMTEGHHYDYKLLCILHNHQDDKVLNRNDRTTSA